MNISVMIDIVIAVVLIAFTAAGWKHGLIRTLVGLAAMVLAVLCIQYDLDDSIASEGIFISTVMSMVTIPFVIWLLL